jgi:parvulin-like peptidyl-prolyl isomerase
MISEENGQVGNEQSNGSKKFRSIVITGVVALVLGLLLALGYMYKSLFVAATVNGQPISRLAVVKELEKQGGSDVLDTLINKKLIEKEAQDKNIKISSEEIDQEVKNYEEDFGVNGGSLDQSLEAQGLTREYLREQIEIQKNLEKLLGEKLNITDEEINAYLQDSGITLTPENTDNTKEQIKQQLRQQKLGQESSKLIEELRSKATIKKLVDY